MKVPASLHVHLMPYVQEEGLYEQYLRDRGNGRVTQAIIESFVAGGQDETDGDGIGVQNLAGNLRVFSTKGLNTRFDADVATLSRLEDGSASMPVSILDGLVNTILFATKMANCGEGGSRYAAAPDSSFAAFFGQDAATERATSARPGSTYQLRPEKHECRPTPLTAQSFSREGQFVGMADASVRVVSPNVDPRTWNLLLQPNDGMKLVGGWWSQ
jgi:hypothetical protein